MAGRRSTSAAAKATAEKKDDELTPKPVGGSDRLKSVVLAAVTLEENNGTNDGSVKPHKFQIMKQGDNVAVQRTEDSAATSICVQAVKYSTEAFVEGIKHITSEPFKKFPAITTVHADVNVSGAKPRVVVKAVDGSGYDLTLTRHDTDDATIVVEVGGYKPQFDEDDLIELIDLMQTKMEVRPVRS